MTPLDKKVCDFLVEVEGCKLTAYHDVKGVITIAIGLARTYLDGTPIKIGDTCTQEQADEWLLQYLQKHVYGAVRALSDDLPDSVFVALCSFGYNVGCGFFKSPSFSEPISNQDWGTFDGTNASGLATTLLKYDKITIDGQRVMSTGLRNRRVKEIKYMLKGLE